jgi:hypothetical protein
VYISDLRPTLRPTSHRHVLVRGRRRGVRRDPRHAVHHASQTRSFPRNDRTARIQNNPTRYGNSLLISLSLSQCIRRDTTHANARHAIQRVHLNGRKLPHIRQHVVSRMQKINGVVPPETLVVCFKSRHQLTGSGLLCNSGFCHIYNHIRTCLQDATHNKMTRNLLVYPDNSVQAHNKNILNQLSGHYGSSIHF